MPGWAAKPLREVPLVEKDEPGDSDWYPIQHHLGLTAAGVNVYGAAAAGDELLGRHDETHSDQEELTSPRVVREAHALEAGTMVVAFGGEPRERFESSWESHHFEGVPQA